MSLDVEVLQGALRLLFLLDRAGRAPRSGSAAEAAGAVAVVESEKRLQALHFWMRNPDYLALEILNSIARGEGTSLSTDLAERLLEGDEPELRNYPMLRLHFGAYEPIDDSMAHLVSVGLAVCRRTGDPAGLRRTDFWLLPAGREVATRTVEEFPQLAWYAERAELVALVAGPGSGRALKDRHYEIPEYAGTPKGERIPPVADLVRARLAALREQAS